MASTSRYHIEAGRETRVPPTRAENKAERLVMLRDMLRDGKAFTVAELSDRLGVHQATIYRDLLTLDVILGVPLERTIEVRWRVWKCENDSQ